MNSFFWKSFSVLALALVIAGCGTPGPRVYKAGGTVTYNGQPVSGAAVTFKYEDGNSAAASTDAAGKFNLTYMGNPKGAAAGKCTVAVSKIAGPAGMTPPSGPASKDPMEMTKMMQKMGEDQLKKAESGQSTAPKNELPAKYAEFSTSGFSFEITTDESKNNFDIPLKD